MVWLILAFAAITLGGVTWWFVQQTREHQRLSEHRRRRYLLPAEASSRVPLAGERDPQAAPSPIDEVPVTGTPARPEVNPLELTPDTFFSDEEPPSMGRLVHTEDGEMLLTHPPFELRPSVLNRREAAYAASIAKRLPPGLALCPKVRLESLITPTAPDGRDPGDWRVWRRRVRMRSVDLVIFDARPGRWRPVVAVEVDRPEAHARRLAGGVDRLLDEVLNHVGLPLVRCSGHPRQDWGMIAPYVSMYMAEQSQGASA